jgi:DNA-binding protein YbaB
MNIFDQGKKMLELRAQQKKLAKMNIEVEENDVKVTMGGDFKIKDLIINGRKDQRIIDTLNKAIDKTQKAAAKETQALLGDLFGMK